MDRSRPFQKGEVYRMKEPTSHKGIVYTILDGFYLDKSMLKGTFKNHQEGWRVLVCEGYEWGDPICKMEVMLNKLEKVYE
jgi:hypothetical protein